LAKTPFSNLLVYALERRLSGTFEFSLANASIATMVVLDGGPAKVRTEAPVHHLGMVMMELGMITPEHLAKSLVDMQQRPQLQGQILLELGALDPALLEAGLRAQIERKVEYLFTLSSETTFAYYDGFDLLQGFGGSPTPIDPLPVLWRGMRQSPAWEHVEATLQRIANAWIRVFPNAPVDRFGLAPVERQVVEALRQHPARLLDITNSIGTRLGQALVYFLMILRQVDLIDPSQMPAQAEAQGLPQPAAPPAAPPASSSTGADPGSSAGQQAPATGQAFARVQLQRQARAPLVVEEQMAVTSNDGRASLPSPPLARGTPTPGASADPSRPISADAILPAEVRPEPESIGSMISHSVSQSGMPPPTAYAAAPTGQDAPTSNPGAPPTSNPGVPPTSNPGVPPTSNRGAPPESKQLTKDQSAVRVKILERAAQITSQDFFQMLGVERDAPTEAVQKAFIGLAKVWHPDRLPAALADVKSSCSKVFAHITEAHATLCDPVKRQEYMTLLKEGGATPDDQAQIQAILEAATEFQKAEFLLKRNLNDPQAYEIVKRCVMLDNAQPDYMATLAWLDAQKPEWRSREKTLEKVHILDRCIEKNPKAERALFFRAMLYKRIEETAKAIKDFKRVAELNPRNLDAVREVRLHHMRGGSKPPPGTTGARSSRNPPPAETIGGLFNKLFKK
jgi:hypothetical protein